MSSPQLASRRVMLRPTRFENREEIIEVLDGSGLEDVRGAGVFLGSLPEDLGTLDAAFLVEERSQGSTVGVCAVFGVDSDEKSAQVSILVEDGSPILGVGVETYVFFIGHVFSEWDVNNIHFWSTEELVGMIPVGQAVISESRGAGEERDGESANRARAFTIEREVWEIQSHRFRSWIMRGPQKSRAS